jgi:hypothetical protein
MADNGEDNGARPEFEDRAIIRDYNFLLTPIVYNIVYNVMCGDNMVSNLP